jgi:hypothetical protein
MAMTALEVQLGEALRAIEKMGEAHSLGEQLKTYAMVQAALDAYESQESLEKTLSNILHGLEIEIIASPYLVHGKAYVIYPTDRKEAANDRTDRTPDNHN